MIRIPRHTVLGAGAGVKRKDAGGTQAQYAHCRVIHRPIAMRMYALAWSVTIDADAIHGVECTVEGAKLV